MHQIAVIARNTILESVRNKVLYVILVFGVIILMVSGALAQLDEQIQAKVVKDISYFAISFFGLILALFLTIEQVPNELERKTIYFLLTKPVYRFEFLLGKFVGVLAVLLGSLALMGGVLIGLLASQGAVVDANLVRGLIALGSKLSIFVGVLVFFSTFLSKILNVTLAFFIYLFGHVGEFLEYSFSEGGSALVGGFLSVCQILLPNFRNFDVQTSVVHDVQISFAFVGVLAIYALLYTVFFLLMGHLIFRSRDL